MLKSVGYAYPSSSYAVQFGYAKAGCWVVKTHKSVESVGKPVSAFAVEADANTFAETLDAEWCALRNPAKRS